jgi:Na+/glutamate symporter
MKNKKASALDTILAVATIFGLVVFALVVVYTYDRFIDTAENTTMNDTVIAMNAMKEIQTVNLMWDYVILSILIGFTIAMIILGYFIDVHTVWFPIFVIVMLVGVLVSAVLSYTWDQIADTTIFAATKAAYFPISTHVMNNLVLYYCIIAGLALIATYAKTRADQ